MVLLSLAACAPNPTSKGPEPRRAMVAGEITAAASSLTTPSATSVPVAPPPTLPSVTSPTPTLPPAVATAASYCPGRRTGAELDAGRVISASYEAGTWVVEVEGLWVFAGMAQATPPGSTPDLRYRGQELINRCELRIDAESGYVGQGSYSVVTATPPP